MSRTQCHSSATRGKCRASQLLFLLLWFGKTLGSIHIPSGLKEPPLITLQSQSYTAFYTDDVSLRCEASGKPKPTFRWVKDGVLIKEERNGSGNFIADPNEELKFYQGTYRCYASNELGTAESGLIELITEPIPVSVKDKRVVKRVNVIEGESVELQCNIPNSTVKANIHWMDKKLMHIKQSERVTIGLNGNLYFANVLISNTRDDYTCYTQYVEARTILSTDPVFLHVIPSNEVVNRHPGLHQPKGTHTNYFALRGQTLILECIPYGLPTPSIKWERKDASFSSTKATEERFGRWLEFTSISESDDGEYTCTASNIMGQAKHSYTVTVEAAPYWTKQPKSSLYSPSETVRLDCHADGIPTPHIVWKINGVAISETSPDTRRTVKGGTLILIDVQLSDTAVYQCEASNKHGTAILNTYIHVVELPPQILTDDRRVYKLMEGSMASLYCSSFGSPRPQISWESEEFGSVLSNPRMSQMTNGTLHITNVSYDDAGTYLCSIKKTNISITALLVVLNRTRIVSPLHDLRVKHGNSLVWPCRYEVDNRFSKPLIQWRKKGQKITTLSPDDKYTVFENGSLWITDITLEDAGPYSCEVITRLDSDMTTGSLTVIHKPERPHSLKLDEKANRSVTLSWSPGDDNNSPVFEFVIEMLEEPPLEAAMWKELKRVPAEIHHLEISLLPFCTYHFKVAAINEIGPSDFSKPSESYTTPPAAPDMNPEKVRSESTDPETMTITWEELEPRHFNGKDFGYKVSWRDATGPEKPWQSATVSHPPFIVNNTDTFVPFEIKVQAVNSIGEGPSPEAGIGYSGEDIPVEAPDEIDVTLVNATAASVKWNPISRESVRGHLLGYMIYLRRLGSRGDSGKKKRALATVKEMVRDMEHVMEREDERQVIIVEGKEEATVSGLDFYSDYELSIAAFNSKGEGPLSPPTRFETAEGAPGRASHLRFESPSETELKLFWKKPHKTNGILKGYIITHQEFVENGPSTIQSMTIEDPTVTQYTVDKLDSKNYYIFSLRAFTAAGEGEPIHVNATTLLDGVPPTSVNATVGETSVNLSWVPGERHRNTGFTVHYLRNGDQWEESEQVNLTQAFYQLQGLKAGTKYRLEIRHNNLTYWTFDMKTTGPEVTGVKNGFATQGWFIGLISAVVLLLLLLLILCFVKKSKGGKYSVKDKEEGQIDSDAKPMKDDAFGEYRSLESSDNDEKRSFSQRSLCPDLKRASDDSLVEYGDSVDIQFNEDGSFIGQYSGRRDTQPYPHGEHESSGIPSPTNPGMEPPRSGNLSTSITGVFGGN
ncbi:neural cell adhesion molecule L1.1 isoform X1 [Ictalurus furcatus]|uniref:neural cell adhesion molecule L1.1 isoform X1 n=1 Tax=Ictalurus furcatus TaxID=66913 RepID=UPI0023501737|nr:neural cell adhesion molecule L1.1 isoform X1 [Ictalurus furcatus]XP_053498628.1 neural cell adhesion molecule L1.1 isoform X1 [Ictalurus furcatus]